MGSGPRPCTPCAAPLSAARTRELLRSPSKLSPPLLGLKCPFHSQLQAVRRENDSIKTQRGILLLLPPPVFRASVSYPVPSGVLVAITRAVAVASAVPSHAPLLSLSPCPPLRFFPIAARAAPPAGDHRQRRRRLHHPQRGRGCKERGNHPRPASARRQQARSGDGAAAAGA